MTIPRRQLILLLLLAVSLAVGNTAKEKFTDVILDTDIHQCSAVQKLSQLKEHLEDEESPIMRQVFAWLFPFGPGWNSILGTFYISSVPNFILAFIPAQINPNTLNTMTAFAVRLLFLYSYFFLAI